jgi:branched-chain amino acid aminotransferase
MATFNIWMNGKLVPQEQAVLPVNSAAVFYATNVFEGIRSYWSERDGEMYSFRLADHFARLRESMKMMRFTVPYSDDDLFEAVRTVVAGNELREDIHMHCVAYVGAPGLDATTQTGLYINPRKRPRVMEGKSGSNYQNGRLATLQSKADGYDQPIFLNRLGKVAEGSGATFFMVRKGRIVTPHSSSDILESITRTTLIEYVCPQVLGMEVVERDIDRTELYVAEEAFFCGSGYEITPILSIDRFALGAGDTVGPVTKRISSAYMDLVRGVDTRHPEWRTPVYKPVHV